MTIDRTHDAEARSWMASADDHADFPVQNLPLGVYSLNGAARRIGTIIGDWCRLSDGVLLGDIA